MGSLNMHNLREGLAYAGEISPTETWNRLKNEKNALLIDVRTPPEWTFSGEPNLSELGKDILKISWKLFPTYEVNNAFSAAIKAAGIDFDTPLFFICRTGGRSLDAACAAAEAGYNFAYNVTDGFEGPLDKLQQRGTVSGWKASHLPWRQG
jgi:rhodanese-related sulfurtransferase